MTDDKKRKTILPPETAQGLADEPKALKAFRGALERKHEHLIKAAKNEAATRTNDDILALFGATRESDEDDDGGGYLRLTFPRSWTEEQVSNFVQDVLGLAPYSCGAGAGRYFQECSTWRHVETDQVIFSARWGYDV